MKPQPNEHAEISGLLDGELTPSDTERIRRAIAEDEELCAEHEELAALDNELKALAAASAFQPCVSVLPELVRAVSRSDAPAFSRFGAPALVALLILRVTLKSLPVSIGCVIAVVVLVCAIAGMVRLLKATDNEVPVAL
jgi:anti-sigma factor RsiW